MLTWGNIYNIVSEMGKDRFTNILRKKGRLQNSSISIFELKSYS